MSQKNVWGLIIQGPLLSYGQGPNISKIGYNSFNSVETNIKNFHPFINKIVISTWLNSGFRINKKKYADVFLIETQQPQNDPDNRIKQFLSTYNGAKFLSLNSGVTHILKIRTDQIIDPKIVNWLDWFFNKNDCLISDTKQQGFLVFSDMLKNTPYYMGDFIFAGKTDDILSFCEYNLFFRYRNIHPSIGKDYMLKYISMSTSSFWNKFNKRVPLLFQIHKPSASDYWLSFIKTRFSVIPSSFFWTILWRGNRMKDVIENSNGVFLFYDEWSNIKKHKELTSKNKSTSFLDLIIKVFKDAKYEYYRYYRVRGIFYLNSLKFFLMKQICKIR